MLQFTLSEECLEVLYCYGASPTFRFEDGSTVLHHLPQHRRGKNTCFIGASEINQKLDHKHKPWNSYLWLVRHGADVNAQDLNGEIPLMALAASSETKNKVLTEQMFIAGVLIDAGANLSLRRNDGMTALEIARKNDAHILL